MICSTLCFFTGTRGLLRSYQNGGQPQTKSTDLRGAAQAEKRLDASDEGNPQAGAPPAAVDASVDALRSGATHYGPASELPELRDLVARDVSSWSRIRIDPEDVVVLPGSNSFCLRPCSRSPTPGTRLSLFDPGFPAYASLARLVGCAVRFVRLESSSGFRPDVDTLEAVIGSRTRIVVANWPHNPTGTILRASDAMSIADVIRRHEQLTVVSDELYRDLEFVDGSTSLFTTIGDPNRCILMDGFSKRWAMTGWRIGFAIASANISSMIEALAANMTTCATTFSQVGALAALRTGDSGKSGCEASCGDSAASRSTNFKRQAWSRRCLRGGLYSFPRVGPSWRARPTGI
jgi:aspartate/methionine/tyrosine aminotransferase